MAYSQLSQLTESIIENCLDETASEIIKVQLKRATEAATEDTARMILRTEARAHERT
jgi:hypothetical protein